MPPASLNAWQTTSASLIGMPDIPLMVSSTDLGMDIDPPFAASVPKGMLAILASSPELEVSNMIDISPARGTKLRLVMWGM